MRHEAQTYWLLIKYVGAFEWLLQYSTILTFNERLHYENRTQIYLQNNLQLTFIKKPHWKINKNKKQMKNQKSYTIT